MPAINCLMPAGSLRIVPTDFLHDLLYLLQHDRLAATRDLCRVHAEHIPANPPENRIFPPRTTAAERQDLGNGNARPDRWSMVVDSDSAQFPHNVDDNLGIP